MFNYHSNYSKVHNYKLKKKKKKIRNLTLGTFGLQSKSYGIITTNQFKAIKRITLRVLKPFKGHI
jgi:ribosomal protein L16/L10AE